MGTAIDLAEIRASCVALEARLQGHPQWPELRAVYLELAPLLGQLQGAVGEAARRHPETERLNQTEAAFERFKSGARQVGLEIRLASEGALLIGLEQALACALESLDQLQLMES